MKTYSVMVFLISMNLAAFIIQQSGAIVGSQSLWIDPTNIQDKFSLTIITAALLGGGAITLVAVLFRPGIYAVGALLVWVILALAPIAQWFLLGTPLMLTAILPAELSYLSYVVSAFFAVMFFMFLVEIMSQRQIT